jgi:enamine deaminase RidA (YjgF/YER057c/UK114 family)
MEEDQEEGMKDRINIPAGTVWEDIVGYSRAVRMGNLVEVAGTAAVDENSQVVSPGNPYAQTVFILAKIERALKAAGATFGDVVRTRIYLTDISRWEEVGKAHGEVFREIKPATTMVEVKALISPELLVEIEATAVVDI